MALHPTTASLSMSSTLSRYKWLAAASVTLIVIGCLFALFVPAGLGWDFANFYDAGRRFAAGQHEDLYHTERQIQGKQPQGKMSFWGTPLSAAIYAPLSLFPPETAIIVFKGQNTVAYLLALSLLFFHLRPLAGDDPDNIWRFTGWFWFAALIYQPFWTVFRVGGQSTPTVFLLCVISLITYTAGRFGWSSLLLMLAVMIKPALVLVFALLALLSPGRFWLFTAIHGLVLGSLSLLLFGLDVHIELVQKVLSGATWIPRWSDNSSLYIVPEHLRQWALENSANALSAAMGTMVPVIRLGVLATLAAVCWQARKQPWKSESRRHFTFHLALLFFLLFSLIVWEHYLALLFPFLALLLARTDSLSRSTRALVLGILAFCVLQNLIIGRFLAARFAFESLPELLVGLAYKSAPLWLVWLILLRSRESLFAAYGGFGTTREMVSAE